VVGYWLFCFGALVVVLVLFRRGLGIVSLFVLGLGWAAWLRLRVFVNSRCCLLGVLLVALRFGGCLGVVWCCWWWSWLFLVCYDCPALCRVVLLLVVF